MNWTQLITILRTIQENAETRFSQEKGDVTGLITGSDIINQLKGKEIGDFLLIPENMLKYNDNIFLDDVTTHDLENALNTKIKISFNNGKKFINNILGR
jgi:NifB/MoaA-like Fe-S oxidoreductase